MTHLNSINSYDVSSIARLWCQMHSFANIDVIIKKHVLYAILKNLKNIFFKHFPDSLESKSTKQITDIIEVAMY